MADRQRGLFTHAQATATGVTRPVIARKVEAGVWERVLPRVFRLANAPTSEEQRLLATCLWLGDGALVSHSSAARLWGLECPDRGVEVTVADLRRTVPGITVHRSRDLSPEDRRVRAGIPVTSIVRSLIDVASELDELELAIVVEEAWRRKLADPHWLARRLRKLGTRGRPGARALSRIVADCMRRGEPLESPLEVRLWRLLLVSKLPLPVPGLQFRDDFGQPGRLDFAYPGPKLALEADGFQFHGDRASFERDRVRASRLAALGWRLVHVTRRQLDEQPDTVIERIRRALRFTLVAGARPFWNG